MHENDLSILYEDDEVMVLDKPSGILTHPDGHSREGTVLDWVRDHYPEREEVGEPLHIKTGECARFGLMHRLDASTSGVLLFAKTQESFEFLKQQFQNREIEKKYYAFVYGRMPGTKGVIDRPIGKDPKDFRRRSAHTNARGTKREAVSEYEVELASPEVSLVKVMPKTGRTHQIRVHFKAIHHPVVGDTLYAPSFQPVLGLERLALHAHTLTFSTPQKEGITVTSPLPSDMENARLLLSEKVAKSKAV